MLGRATFVPVGAVTDAVGTGSGSMVGAGTGAGAAAAVGGAGKGGGGSSFGQAVSANEGASSKQAALAFANERTRVTGALRIDPSLTGSREGALLHPWRRARQPSPAATRRPRRPRRCRPARLAA
jgi:hypothetical protein